LVSKSKSTGFPVWASKLTTLKIKVDRFPGLSLKIKLAMVYRLQHKIDGVRTARDTCRDLAACFAYKQVS
jgi:hypothetical protein